MASQRPTDPASVAAAFIRCCPFFSNILEHLSSPVDNTTQKTMLQTGRQPLNTKVSNRTLQITEHKEKQHTDKKRNNRTHQKGGWPNKKPDYEVVYCSFLHDSPASNH